MRAIIGGNDECCPRYFIRDRDATLLLVLEPKMVAEAGFHTCNYSHELCHLLVVVCLELSPFRVERHVGLAPTRKPSSWKLDVLLVTPMTQIVKWSSMSESN